MNHRIKEGEKSDVIFNPFKWIMLIFKGMKDTYIYVRYFNVDFFSFLSYAQPRYLLLQYHSLCAQIIKSKPNFVLYISFSFLELQSPNCNKHQTC